MSTNNQSPKTTLEVGDMIEAVNMGKVIGKFLIENVSSLYAFNDTSTFKRGIKDNGLIDRVDARKEPQNTEYRLATNDLFQTYNPKTHKTSDQVLAEGFRDLANDIEGSNLGSVRAQVLREMLMRAKMFLETSAT